MPSRQLPQPSTPDLARPLGGERPPRRLTRCYDRFTLALRRPVEPGQYTSLAFGKRCREAGVRPSMGSVGDAYDNAMCESFFATLECELLARRRFASQVEARMAVFSYLESWYNPLRLHSALGYRSPTNYEREHVPTAALAT